MNVPDCTYHLNAIAALLDGAPDAALPADTLRHLESCHGCRAEYEWLRVVSGDLEAMGAAFAKQTPALDIASAVMDRIAALPSSPSTVVPIQSRERRFPWAAAFAGLAAAACLALVSWVVFWGHDGTRRDRDLAMESGRNQGPKESLPANVPTDDSQASLDNLRKAIDLLHKYDAPKETGKTEFLTTASPDVRSLTTHDVMATRKAAVTDPAARERLYQWASLAPDTARQIAQAPGTPAGAVVGAAASLDPSEAAPLLLTAVGTYPDRPAVRLALVKAYQSQSSPDTVAQANDLLALDPKNALGLYLQALALLNQNVPDVQGALDLLKKARALPIVSAYSLESDSFKEEALVAAGMDPDTARSLCAMTSGHEQYEFLASLGQKLLDKAQLSLSQGDTQTAREITEAVQQLGKQTNEGAPNSQERLAALNMQRDAILLLQTIYSSLGDSAEIQQLTVDTQELAGGMEDLYSFLNELGNLFIGATDQVFGLITNIIRQTGDLTVFEHLT